MPGFTPLAGAPVAGPDLTRSLGAGRYFSLYFTPPFFAATYFPGEVADDVVVEPPPIFERGTAGRLIETPMPRPRRRVEGTGAFVASGPRLVGHGRVVLTGSGAIAAASIEVRGVGGLRVVGLGDLQTASVDVTGAGAIYHIVRASATPTRRVIDGVGRLEVTTPRIAGVGDLHTAALPPTVDTAWEALQREALEEDELLLLLGVLD